MLSSKRKIRWYLKGPLALIGLLALAASAFANISGAIYTSLPDGTRVNQNLYASPDLPYLNGGPNNPTSPGLPDGIYYFQVTIPNGSLLLSNDPATDRLIQVVNGHFAGRVHNDPPTFTPYPPGVPPYPPVPPPPYPHPNGPVDASDGSTPCQLWPYDQTTNQGGEYKVWLIPYNLATVDTDGIHLIFDSGDSKTDNYKIGGTVPGPTFATIAGHKFYDSNMNGTDAPGGVPEGEKGVTGFVIHIILTDAQANPVVLSPAPGPPVVVLSPGVYEIPTTTGGNWSLPSVPTGTNYSVYEVLPAGDGHWFQTGPGAPGDPLPPGWTSRGYSGTVGTVDITDLNFGNIEQGRVGGQKFYDTNMNGVFDQGELGVANVPIHIVVTLPDITHTVVTEDVDTASDGTFMSSYYPDGSTYVITEVLSGHWIQTFPTSNGSQSGTIGPGTPFPTQFQDYDVAYTIADTTNKNFGNIERGRISGVKFYDTDMNGTKGTGELPISGFHIDVTFTEPDTTVVTEHLVTDVNGAWTSQYYPDGTTYSASEVLPAGWMQTAPNGNLLTGTIGGSGGPYDFDTFTIPDVTGLNFGNIATGKIRGHKFYDTNMNGAWDLGEPTIQGFKIVITATYPNASVHTQTLYTDVNGEWVSQGFPDGTTYSVAEVMPSASWHRTMPVSATYTGTISGGVQTSYDVTFTITDITGLDFGNWATAGGGGHTPGYWSNKNGQAKMTQLGMATELAMLNALCLFNASGTSVDFANYAAFKNWLLKGTATNMAYMLSVQFAAMKLNVAAGYVSSSSLIYAPGTTSANAQGFATVGAILTETQTELCTSGHNYTIAGSPYQAYQEALKNALDNANNNLNFASGPITIIVPSPY